MTEEAINTEIPLDGIAMPGAEVDQAPAYRDEVPALTDAAMPPTGEASASPEDTRSHLTRQFEHWLDGMFSGESEPPIPRELIDEALAQTQTDEPESSNADMYSLFAAVTRLSGEIGLQGRTFKQLSDTLAPVAQLPGAIEAMEETQRTAGRQFDRLAEQLQPKNDEAALPSSKDVLAALFDLLERLERGMKTFEDGIASVAANQPRGIFARLGGAKRHSADTVAALQAMHEGYRMTHSRLQASLDQWNIQRIGHKGDAFDPSIMTAIEIDSTGSHRDGDVTEVYRSGYVHHGRILAAAQVKVAKQA